MSLNSFECVSHVGALCAVLLNGAHLFSASISRMCCRVHPATCPCPRWGGSIFYRWRNFWPTAAPREAGVLCPVRWNSAVSKGESTTSTCVWDREEPPNPIAATCCWGADRKQKARKRGEKAPQSRSRKGFTTTKTKARRKKKVTLSVVVSLLATLTGM